MSKIAILAAPGCLSFTSGAGRPGRGFGGRACLAGAGSLRLLPFLSYAGRRAPSIPAAVCVSHTRGPISFAAIAAEPSKESFRMSRLGPPCMRASWAGAAGQRLQRGPSLQSARLLRAAWGPLPSSACAGRLLLRGGCCCVSRRALQRGSPTWGHPTAVCCKPGGSSRGLYSGPHQGRGNPSPACGSSSSNSNSSNSNSSTSSSSNSSSNGPRKTGSGRREGWRSKTVLAAAAVPVVTASLLKPQQQQQQDQQKQHEEAPVLSYFESRLVREMQRVAEELRALLPASLAFRPNSSSSSSSSSSLSFPVWDVHAWLRFSRSFSSLVVSTLDYKWTFRRLAAMEAREQQLSAAAAAAAAAASSAAEEQVVTGADEEGEAAEGGPRAAAGASRGSPECAQRHQAEASRLETEAAALRARRQAAEVQLHERGARRFLRVCIGHGGLYTKLGQYVATLQHVLPAPYISILSQLQDDAARLPWPEARAVLEAELGGPLELFFQEFAEEAVAAASLAQVHWARRRSDGAEVAVKLQRPRLQQDVASDLVGLRVLMGFVSLVFPHCRFSWLLPEFETNMRQELNFKQEGFNAMRLRRLLAAVPDVYVPWVDWELTTERVLTMEFVRGAKLTDAEALRRQGIYHSQQVADILMRAFGDMLHLHGLVHCDPHPGNLLVRRMPKPALLQQQQQQADGQQGQEGCCICSSTGSHQRETPHEAEGRHASHTRSSSSSSSSSSSEGSRNEGPLQLVVLDHGMYRRLSPEFRLAFSRLWLALLLNDVNEGRRALRELGIRKHLQQQQQQQQLEQQRLQRHRREQSERRWAAAFPALAFPGQASGDSNDSSSSSSIISGSSSEEQALFSLDEDTALDLLSVVLTYRPQLGLRTQLGAPLDAHDRARVMGALRGAPVERINGVLQLLPRDLLWVLRMSYLIRSINCDMGGSTKHRLVAMGEAACRGVQLGDAQLSVKLAECEAFAAAAAAAAGSSSSSMKGGQQRERGAAPRWFELPGCESLNLPVASEYPAYSTWFFTRGCTDASDEGAAPQAAESAEAAAAAAHSTEPRAAAAAAPGSASSSPQPGARSSDQLQQQQQQQLLQQLDDPMEDLYTQLVLVNGAEQAYPLAAYRSQRGEGPGPLQEQQLLLLLQAQAQAVRSSSQSPLLLHSLSGEPGPSLPRPRRRCSRCGKPQTAALESSNSSSSSTSSSSSVLSGRSAAVSEGRGFAGAAAATAPPAAASSGQASRVLAEAPWAPLGFRSCLRFLLLRTEMFFTILLLRVQLWVVDFVLRLAVGPAGAQQQQPPRPSYG
ncbi:hypothetical protein Efla_004225 [Eimeria flavescens]